MTFFRKLRSGVLTTLATSIIAVGATGMISSAQAQGFRPEIGKPLQDAARLAKERKFSEANAKLREAEAVSGRTAAENAAIEQMKGYIATSSGDTSAAIKSYESQ